MKNEIEVWIVDNEPIFTKGLCKILNDHNIQNIKEYNSPKLALNILRSGELPDLILLDINMGELNGVEMAKIITSEFPSIKIIGLSTYKGEVLIANMLDAGAVAYLAKDSETEDLYEALDHVISEGFHYSPEVLKIINNRMIKAGNNNRSRFDENFLTSREKEILVLICLQKKTAEIAEKLFISERTVEGHRNNLLQKTGSTNSIGLLTFALQVGLIDLDYIDLNIKP